MILHAAKILEALTFAAEQHKYQRRAGFEPLPYINHILKVTDALVNIGHEKDTALILSAILHDVVEDTNISFAEITEKFGHQVRSVVEELTDDMSLSYAERKRLQVQQAHQLSLPARKIRIADKASNLEDIFTYELDWPIEKKMAYLENAIQVVEKIRGSNDALEKWFDEIVNRIKNNSK